MENEKLHMVNAFTKVLLELFDEKIILIRRGVEQYKIDILTDEIEAVKKCISDWNNKDLV